jgi:serine/threonine protein phosphatase PrpC
VELGVKVVTAFNSLLGNRSGNQDRLLVEARPDCVLLVVADGMGGHARGDLAAQTAVDSLRSRFLDQREVPDDPRGFLAQALNHAHFQVVDAGLALDPPLEPRTTCVACLVIGNRAWWGHLGDSRLYLVRDGSVATRTRDHSPVEDMLRKGLIDEASSRRHPMRNSINRCLGGSPVLPKASFGDTILESGDTLLLCSDGLWSALSEDVLADLPEDGNQLEQYIDRLTDAAQEATYPHSDNVTLVALRWLGESDADGPATRRAATAAPPRPHPPQATPEDPVQSAIDEIRRAVNEYADEMKK